MKNARSRHARSRRNSTPSVICLPGPKYPAPPRKSKMSVGPALRLPAEDEPLVLPATSDTDMPSRQVRRQQMREQRKARLDQAAAQPVASSAAPATGSIDGTVPLARNRSLVPMNRSGWAKVVQWVRGLIPARRGPSDLNDAAVQQLHALRREVAGLQRTLDRMLAATAKT